MPINGLSIPRRVHQLPQELVQRRGDLDNLLTVAADAVDAGSFGAESTVKVARRMMRQGCSSYRPSSAHHNDVLCKSGEETGQPYRADGACNVCRAGQFSANGFFVGEMTSEMSPVDVTLADLVQTLQA